MSPCLTCGAHSTPLDSIDEKSTDKGPGTVPLGCRVLPRVFSVRPWQSVPAESYPEIVEILTRFIGQTFTDESRPPEEFPQ